MERISDDFAITFNVSRFSRGVDISYGVTPPTELATLAAVVAGKHEVVFCDANALNLYPGEVCEWIRRESPDFLIVRSGDATLTGDAVFYHYAEAMGVRAVLWEDTLNPLYSDRLMRDFHLKRVLYGEPERRIFDILDGAEGAVGGDILEDMDSLPQPLMDVLPMDRYVKEGKRTWFSFLQRGCGWGQCSFCLIAPSDITHRMRSIGHIREELDMLKARGIQSIYFWDPQINPSRERVLELCELFSQYPFRWEAWARVDVMDQELAAAMKRSGCFRLHLGLENGDNRVLASLCKGTNTDMIRRAFRVLRRHGIERAAYLCMGTPEESEDSFRRTIALIREIKPSTIVPASYRPFPNVPLTETAQKCGMLVQDHYDLSIRGDSFGTATVTRTKHMTAEEVAHWMGRIHKLSTRIALRSYLLKPSVWKPFAHIFLVRTIRSLLIGRRKRSE
jgi:radical SAM superfamily enzyme YgiQ (UPF0313 family)